MSKRLPQEALYRVREPKNFHTAMESDVRLLLEHRAYLSLTTVIMSCLDALAAGSGKATRGKFCQFIEKHFPVLCADLEKANPGTTGADTLYANFRNGFVHLRSPKPLFAIAEEHELDGMFADKVEIDGVGCLIALNIDRLRKLEARQE